LDPSEPFAVLDPGAIQQLGGKLAESQNRPGSNMNSRAPITLHTVQIVCWSRACRRPETRQPIRLATHLSALPVRHRVHSKSRIAGG